MIHLLLFLVTMHSQSFADSKKEWDYYGKKVNFQCGTSFKSVWQDDILKKHVSTIKNGQTSGSRRCNEPMRYLYYACKDSQLKKKVKRLNISKIVCTGTSEKLGSLSLSSGVLTVALANQEAKPYLRSYKQFKKVTRLKLAKLPEDNPSQDNEWRELRNKKNPATDARNYCLVNGKKIELNPDLPRVYQHYDPMKRKKQSGYVRCWRNGKLYVDLKINKGLESGFVTKNSSPPFYEESFKNGKRHGLEKRYGRDGRLHQMSLYDEGKKVWTRKYYRSGKLREYDRNFNPFGYKYETAKVQWLESGKMSSLSCNSRSAIDKVFVKVCGFNGKSKVKLYNNKGKINKIIFFVNGKREEKKKEKLRDGKTITTNYKQDKRHGLEVVKKKNGQKLSSINWKNGHRHGESKYYHEKEDKIVKLVNYKKGVVIDTTHFYLNQQKKSYFKRKGKTMEDRVYYHDNGKIAVKGQYFWCKRRWWSFWCRNGEHKSFYETGKKYSVTNYKKGVRTGIGIRTES